MNRGATPSERISAVIACYLDAQAIPIMHERLTAMFGQLGVDYEIIFVNDGSPDDSREVLRELAACDRRVVVITHTRAFGSQSAFTSGMRLATGDAVVLLDGDLQDPPELIPELVERWREGYEVVYGERTDREGRRLMRWAYKLFYRLFRRTSYMNVPVDAGEFGLMDRRVVAAHRDRAREASAPRPACSTAAVRAPAVRPVDGDVRRPGVDETVAVVDRSRGRSRRDRLVETLSRKSRYPFIYSPARAPAPALARPASKSASGAMGAFRASVRASG